MTTQQISTATVVMETNTPGRCTCVVEMCGGNKRSEKVVYIHPNNEENSVCSILGGSIIQTFDGQILATKLQGDFVIAVDAISFNWYIYVRYYSHLYTVTIYNKNLIFSVHRFGRIRMENSVVTRELQVGSTLNLGKGHTVTRTLGSVVVRSSEYTIVWNRDRDLFLSVPLGRASIGICGNNVRGFPSLRPRLIVSQATVVEEFLSSWRLNSDHRKIRGEEVNFPAHEPRLRYCLDLVSRRRGCSFKMAKALTRLCAAVFTDRAIEVCDFECFLDEFVVNFCT
eukprot:sb/3467836/